MECARCGARADADKVAQLCACGGPYLARYDLVTAGATLTRAALALRPNSLWRYRELLPLRRPDDAVSLGEAMTAVLALPRTGARLGVESLYVKDEALLPGGSFKARGAAVGVSKARELGVTELALPTNGNAGGAWAAYCARAGIAAHMVMPRSAPAVHRWEVASAGADLRLIDGLISDAGKIVAADVAAHGWYDASTLKEPYRIEGKKTMGFELVEQFGWRPPDVVVYPTGGGVGLIGMHKAVEELRELGLVAGDGPRFVAVQAEGCAPIVQAFARGAHESEFWHDAKTLAFGINVPKALGDFLVLRAIRQSKGCAVAVSDDEIGAEWRRLGGESGVAWCPEGAACVAAIGKLREQEWLRGDERVLAINTAAGSKYNLQGESQP